jgi:C1A family cysteine protease
MSRRYNWRPDPPDFRDRKYLRRLAEHPNHVDLRPQCPPIVDQGDIGSCTGNALAGALGFLEFASVGAAVFNPFSRLFIYYNERVAEGDPGYDGGANLRDGITTLAAQGACFEDMWKYSDSLTFIRPPVAAYQQALPHRITDYLALDNTVIAQLKDCLASGFPFVFGFTVYESFESPAVAQSGIVPLPLLSESPLGGHAVMCVGYDDMRRLFIVRNSWGTGWGDKGYFYLPYVYMTDPDLTDSAWKISK